jgi:oligopeptide transport system substrate-binding protein
MRTDRHALPIGLLVAAACVIGACGTSSISSAQLASADKQIYRVNDITEPNSYDPGQETYSYEGAIGRQVFEALLKPKADLTDVQPAAAASYDVSSDGLTYTFHLQPNGKWSDGQPVTAQDFVYGWQRLLNPALAAGYVDPFFDQTIAGASTYGSIDATNASAIDSFLQGLGLSAPDDHTFVVKLAHPAAYFKWVATLWVGAPIRKDVVERAAGGSFPSTDSTKAEAWAQSATTLIGNGPFKISEIVAKDHVSLVPNPNYWGGPSKLQQLIFYFIADANTTYSEYQTGALDQINVPLADNSVVRNDPVLSKQAHLIPELSVFWMTYNTKEAPLDNADVRMALSKSIDRDKLAQDVEQGTVKAMESFFPRGMNGYDDSDKAQSFDPTAAKALLARAGVSASQLSKLKLLTRNSTRNKTLNQYIVDQWNTNLGTNIQLDVIDSKTVTADIRKGDFDIYGPDGWGADYPDQQDWADVFTSAACHGLNWGCPTLPGYDSIVAKADTETNQTQRNSDYGQAQKMLIDQAAVGFLFQQYEYDLWKPYVHIIQSPFDEEYVPGDQNYESAYILQH